MAKVTTRLGNMVASFRTYRGWRPRECRKCFDEEIVIWKIEEGFQCHCTACKHNFVEYLPEHMPGRY